MVKLLITCSLVILPTLFFLVGFRQGFRWGRTPEKQAPTIQERTTAKKVVKEVNKAQDKEIAEINAQLKAINEFGED